MLFKVLLEAYFYYEIGVYAVLVSACFIVSLVLPVETKGRALQVCLRFEDFEISKYFDVVYLLLSECHWCQEK